MIIWLMFLLAFLWCLWQRRRFYLLHFKLPGVWGLPLIGSAHLVFNRAELLYSIGKHFEKYGPILCDWMGPVPCVLMCDPQAIKDIFTSRHTKKGNFLYPLADGVGDGLFTMDGEEWANHRRLLNTSFTLKVLNSFLPIFNEETSRLLKNMDALVGLREVDVNNVLKSLTMNTAVRTTMDARIEPENASIDEKVIIAFQSIIEIIIEMMVRPWFRLKALRYFYSRNQEYEESKKIIRNYVAKLIDVKLAETKQDSERRVSETEKSLFINLTIDQLRKGHFTWVHLQDHCSNIVAGAFDTTATTLYNILILLAMFPECDKILFDEIKSLIPEKGDIDVTRSELQRMFYMDLVINEAMRVLPTVPLVIREATADIKLSNGVVLPKGVAVAISIFHLHRSKAIWGPDAHTFNPDNFSPSNLRKVHPYAFVPFAKGNRICIGWRYALISMKVTLAKLLRNYRFTTDFKFEDLHFVEDVTIKYKETPLLEIHRRDS